MAEFNVATSNVGVMKETFIKVKQFLDAAAASNVSHSERRLVIAKRIRILVENSEDSASLLVAVGLAYGALDSKYDCESCQSIQAEPGTPQWKRTELTLLELAKVWNAFSARIQTLKNHDELVVFIYFEYTRLWRRALKRLDEAIVHSASKIGTSPELHCLFDGLPRFFEQIADSDGIPVPLALLEWKALKLYNTFLTVGASSRTTTASWSRLYEAQLQFVSIALRVFADEARLASRFEVVSTFSSSDADADAGLHASFVYVSPTSNALLRAFVLLVLRVLHFASTHFDSPTRAMDMRASFSLVQRIFTHRTKHSSRTVRPFLEQVFAEQDDDFIDCLLLLLEVRRTRIVEPHELPEIFKPEIELHSFAESLFQVFVDAFASDVFCVVELLLAPETRALEFVTKCLKCAANSESNQQLPEAPSRQRLLDFVSRVHDKLSTLQQHAQVPFNITPLLRVMGRYAIKSG